MATRKVVITVTVSVSRLQPTPEERERGTAAQATIQALLQDDLDDRARRLEVELNRGGATW